MAMWVMAVAGEAPCQCFSPGGDQTTSPGPTPPPGPPHRWARPRPAVTTSVCPSGWVCQAVRAPGSKVTLAPATRAGSGAWKSGSMRTLPVNQSVGPLPDGVAPLRVISIAPPSELLPGRPEQDLVHVHLVRLLDGEGHGTGERVGRNPDVVVHLPDVGGDGGVAGGVGQLAHHHTG